MARNHFLQAVFCIAAFSSWGTSLLASGTTRTLPKTVTPQRKVKAPMQKIIAYVPNWIDLDAFAPTIEYSKITHINLAFENPIDDSGAFSFNSKNDVLIARAQAHHVPVFISIGGGSASEDKTLRTRYFDLLSDARRARFVALLSDYVSRHAFDGLDVDLEGPAINQNYAAFIKELALALHAKGKLLTAALSQGNGGSAVPSSVFGYFDWINIMAYDQTGPWNPHASGQHSSMQFARNTVEYWLNRGLAKQKVVLGVPFYGYGFGKAFQQQGFAYSAIVASYPGAEQADQAGNTIWYNGIPTIKAKASYVREHELGGIMIWSLNQDVKGKRSLLSSIHETLTR